MLQLKQYVKIIFLFALLFVMVSVPYFFMEHQHEYSFDEIVLYSVDAVRFDDFGDDSLIQNSTIWDRIKLIGDAGSFVQSEEYTNYDDLRKHLLSSMEEQLVLLQEFHALPVLSFSDAAEVSISKETYMDVFSDGDGYANDSALRQTASTWVIEVKYKNLYVFTYMDAETGAILNIALEGSDFSFDSGVTESGFFEYLLTFSDLPSDEDNPFSITSYYSSEKILLFPVYNNIYDGNLQQSP